MWKKMKSYEDVKKDLKDVKASVLKAIPKDKSPDLTGEFDASSKYPFEVLSVRDAMELPEGVDPSRREVRVDHFNCFNLTNLNYNRLIYQTKILSNYSGCRTMSSNHFHDGVKWT